YGGMVPLGGFLGAKQVSLGALAVEAGIFPFLTLIGISSGVAQVHGKSAADQLVRFGFIPLILAIALTLGVLTLPTDPGMYEPAKAAFPIIVGQSWRMMAAGVLAYGVSVTLNVWLFSRLTQMGRFPAFWSFVAAALSQIVDTLIFISVSFYGVRPIADLMMGQMIAKIILSAIMVPVIVKIIVALSHRIDAKKGV
ncbi:MAG: queuosine precursor transporter, partial [Sphingopyxis sp.]